MQYYSITHCIYYLTFVVWCNRYSYKIVMEIRATDISQREVHSMPTGQPRVQFPLNSALVRVRRTPPNYGLYVVIYTSYTALRALAPLFEPASWRLLAASPTLRHKVASSSVVTKTRPSGREVSRAIEPRFEAWRGRMEGGGEEKNEPPGHHVVLRGN